MEVTQQIVYKPSMKGLGFVFLKILTNIALATFFLDHSLDHY